MGPLNSGRVGGTVACALFAAAVTDAATVIKLPHVAMDRGDLSVFDGLYMGRLLACVCGYARTPTIMMVVFMVRFVPLTICFPSAQGKVVRLLPTFGLCRGGWTAVRFICSPGPLDIRTLESGVGAECG